MQIMKRRLLKFLLRGIHSDWEENKKYESSNLSGRSGNKNQ